MVTQKIKELQALQKHIDKLAAAVVIERRAELSGLPSEYGYASVAEFIVAVKEAATAAPGKRRGRPPKAAKAAAAPKAAKAKKRTRAKITPEIRDNVAAALRAGASPKDVSAQFGISTASVQVIKKSAGLVKSRGVAAEPVTPPAAE
jgi:transposase